MSQESDIDFDKTYDVVELSRLIKERQIIFLRKSEVNLMDDTEPLRKYLEEEETFHHLPF